VLIGNSILNKTSASNDSNPNQPGTPIFSTPGNASTTVTNLPELTVLANTPYNGNNNNNGYNQEYIDIDTDPATFSSSSANLNIINSCKKIVYAGLYWAATYPYERSTNPTSNTIGTPRLNDWNQMKFKVPGSAVYVDIVADNAVDPAGDEDSIIFNGYINPLTSFTDAPYVCYKNVTGLLKSLSDANGVYLGANIRAARGFKSDGSASGWTLVVIYESPTLNSKYISVFDGYAGVKQTNGSTDYSISGFKTFPSLPIRASIGFSSIGGDKSLIGDNLQIKANSISTFTNINNAINPLDNVFNSSITIPSTTTPFSINVGTRNPNSANTLGFDLDLLSVPNPGNSVIPNNTTGATIRITSNADTYGVFLTTIAVDAIEPKILLTNTVKDNSNIDITGSSVNLGQQLLYEIGYQNIGNDNATAFTISDVLPINLVFNPITDLILPPGVTYTYNLTTRQIVFTIPNSEVEVGDPIYTIGIKVKVASTCNEFRTACSNLIQNQAFATYQGYLSTILISDEGSIPSFGACIQTPGSTNVLVNTTNCIYNQTVSFCGNSNVILTAANGYSTYVWSGPGTITPVSGTMNQSIMVSDVGLYSVSDNIVAGSCTSITESITVINSQVPSNEVTQALGTLTAKESGAIYQWVNCDTNTIVGGNSQNFSPIASGNYSVNIINSFGCQSISNCIAFVSLNNQDFNKLDVKLYPNPASDQFTIEGDITIENVSVFNLLGQKVLSFKGNKKEYLIPELTKGIYIIEVQTDKGTLKSRLIKK
jgi:large repetitive protein